MYGGRTPIGLTLTAGAMSLLSVAIGIVQFASALPLVFNETRMSEGQEFSKDGGVTSGKKEKGERLELVKLKCELEAGSPSRWPFG